MGLSLGALPGLGCSIAMAIALPFTFGWDPMVAVFLFTGMMGAEAFGGAIPAILLNTPGTSVNAATCFDGFPMTRRGEAGKAIGIAALSSGMGAIFGLIVLLISIPIVRSILFLFGPPEIFMVILFGIVAIAVAARGNILKGLLSGSIGILISLIGLSPVFGILRFNFGSDYLYDGIQLIPVFIGLFAVSQVIDYWAKGGSIVAEGVTGDLGGVREGFKEVFRHKLCFLRSSAIGTIVGIIPGVGGSVANLLSYVAAMQSSSYPERFGTGLPEGVIAAEASNNASYLGAFLPTIAFGIPGSVMMAVVLGMFIFHGLTPGPLFFRDHMDLVFAILMGMTLGNAFSTTVGIIGAKYLAKLATIRVVYIAPVISVLCVTGAFAVRQNIWDVILTLIAGIFGYAMVRFGFSVICLVIGYILGTLAENSFYQSLAIAYGSYRIFFSRPISLVLFILLIIVLLLPFIRKREGSNHKEL